MDTIRLLDCLNELPWQGIEFLMPSDKLKIWDYY